MAGAGRFGGSGAPLLSAQDLDRIMGQVRSVAGRSSPAEPPGGAALTARADDTGRLGRPGRFGRASLGAPCRLVGWVASFKPR
jgi:hypothetical protein